MLRTLTLAFCVVCSMNLMAQLHLDDPNYVYQNTRQDILPSEEVDRLLHSKQHYSLVENKMEDGRTMVTLLPITNATFRQIIREKKKMVMSMKGQKIPDYSLKDVNGNEITNHSFDRAKVTVYNFWFTTCDHCIQEIPKLNNIVKQFPEGVNFIAPTFNTHTQVAKFLEDNTFDYTILTSGKSLATAMHIRSYPTHFVVDHTGTIQKVMIGSSNKVIKHLQHAIRHWLHHETRIEQRQSDTEKTETRIADDGE